MGKKLWTNTNEEKLHDFVISMILVKALSREWLP